MSIVSEVLTQNHRFRWCCEKLRFVFIIPEVYQTRLVQFKKEMEESVTKLLTALEAHLVEFVSSSHSLLSGVDWFAAGGAFGVFSGNERHYGIEFLFVLFCERQKEAKRLRQYWCVKEFWRHYRNLNPHNERFVWKNKIKKSNFSCRRRKHLNYCCICI